jgi:hypothetical protein
MKDTKRKPLKKRKKLYPNPLGSKSPSNPLKKKKKKSSISFLKNK